MNANELADDLWACFTKSDWEYVDEAVAMLRQQQAEIEALRSLSLRRENLGYFYDLHARQQAEIEALKKELETCKTIVALSNIAWERKHGKD